MFVNDENPGEAISAVKSLQKANAQGQRIYHLTPANQAMTLPAIHQNSLVMQEIRAALNAGKEVITHTDPVSVPGWSGAGYILFDPETGDGAFKIGGGQNGGLLAFAGGLFIFVGLYLIPLLAAPGLIALLPFYSLSIGLLAFVAGVSLFVSEVGAEFFQNAAVLRAITAYIAHLAIYTTASLQVLVASLAGLVITILLPYLKDLLSINSLDYIRQRRMILFA